MTTGSLIASSTRPHSPSGQTRTRSWIVQLSEHRHDPSFRLAAALAAVFMAAAAAFAHITEDYLTGDPIVRWDVHFAAWLHHHSSPALVSLFKVATLAGNVAVLALLTALVAFLLLRRRAVNDAAFISIVALGIELLNACLKIVFHRPRPELAYVHLDTYSFPSGHAAGAAAIYGALAFLVWRRRRSAGFLLAGAFVLGVGTIGFSRLYLEAHFLSDVLAGFCLGLAWLSACLLVYVWYGNRSVLSLLPAPARRLIGRAERGATDS